MTPKSHEVVNKLDLWSLPVIRKTTICLGETLAVQIVSEEMHVIIYRVCCVCVYEMVMIILILNLQLKCQALLPVKITRNEYRVF